MDDEYRTLSDEVGTKKVLLSFLNNSITKTETRIKALRTMMSNLEGTLVISTKQLTLQKAKAEAVVTPRIGDVRRTKMR